MRRSQALALSVVIVLLATSAVFAGGVIKANEIMDTLGLRPDAALGGGGKLKAGTMIKAKVLDANKLKAHGFTGAVKNGDPVTVRVTGDKAFSVETMPTAVEKGAAPGAGKGPAGVQGPSPHMTPGAAKGLNFTKTFTINADGKLAAQ
ncbi:MAG TPA: hypothetical protein VGT02_19380 [Methylomirabilota bacterium]|jgi:hypothetical protein|nr:hypothetical protein [Methylomirabilota bacterium]